MKPLKWEPIDRKRRKDIAYTDKSFVRAYDIDMADFSSLVDKFNKTELEHAEQDRLQLWVMTMMNIVLENPKVNPGRDELEDLADQIFYDMWRSLKYIKPNTKPYSYVYLAGITAVSTFYSKKIRERQKVKAIEEHIDEVYREYMAETADPKTPIHRLDK